LANALVSEGNVVEARKVIAEAASLDGDSFDLQILGLGALVNLRVHTDRTNELIVKSTKQIFGMCYFEDRAVRLFGTLSPRVDSVMRTYEGLAEEFAKWPLLQFETAKVYYCADRDDQAVLAAMDAYGRGLRRPELLNLLGVLHRRRGAPKEAFFFYEEALSAWPEDHRLHFNAGLCLEELGRTDDARNAYGECLRIAPTFSKANERITALAGVRSASQAATSRRAS
jgi:tetratricopeptide (TPR) repeat protein